MSEDERKSRFAYQAWQDACEHFGLNVAKPWDDLMEDEQGQWELVYDSIARAALAESEVKP